MKRPYKVMIKYVVKGGSADVCIKMIAEHFFWEFDVGVILHLRHMNSKIRMIVSKIRLSRL